MGAAAHEAGVTIVTGDTKVVERGEADGLYVQHRGGGVMERDLDLSPSTVRAGDRVLVSGTLGDHASAVMVARGDLGVEEVDLKSDTAALGGLTADLLDAAGDRVREVRAGEGEQCLLGHGVGRVGAEDSTAER
jgi:hydrogenase expression/formation protein HypE